MHGAELFGQTGCTQTLLQARKRSEGREVRAPGDEGCSNVCLARVGEDFLQVVVCPFSFTTNVCLPRVGEVFVKVIAWLSPAVAERGEEEATGRNQEGQKPEIGRAVETA